MSTNPLRSFPSTKLLLAGILLVAVCMWCSTRVTAFFELGHDDQPAPEKALVADPPGFQLDASQGSASEVKQIVTQLKNTGRRAIRILSVKSSCGCTIAEALETTSVPPEKMVELKLNVSFPPYDEKSVKVTIITDVVSSPEVIIPIRMIAKPRPVPFVEQYQHQIEITGSRGGGDVTRKIEIKTLERADSPEWLSKLEPSERWLKLDRLEGTTVSPREKGVVQRTYAWKLTVTIPEQRYQKRNASISLTSDQSVPGAPMIYVFARNEPLISAVPRELIILKSDLENGSVERSVLLVCKTPSDWTCSPVDPQPERLAVHVENADGRHRLQLKFLPKFLDGAVDGVKQVETLRLKTSLPDQPDVEIPIWVVAK